MKILLAIAVFFVLATHGHGAELQATKPFERQGRLGSQNPIDGHVRAVLRGRGIKPANICSDAVFFRRFHIRPGGAVDVHIKTSSRPQLKNVELKISDPPQGITLNNIKIVNDRLIFQLRADRKLTKPGAVGNLIIEAHTRVQNQPKKKDGKKVPGSKRRVSLGILPAVPFVVD